LTWAMFSFSTISLARSKTICANKGLYEETLLPITVSRFLTNSGLL
jgi:hypothetical protein